MGTAGVVATRVMFAIGPGRLEFSAGAGALLIQGATHTLPHLAKQGDATRRLVLGAAHGDAVRSDQHHLIVRHAATGRLAFTPKERHTKMRAAGATRKARISVRHDFRGLRNRQGPAPGGLFYAAPSACKAAGRKSFQRPPKPGERALDGRSAPHPITSLAVAVTQPGTHRHGGIRVDYARMRQLCLRFVGCWL